MIFFGRKALTGLPSANINDELMKKYYYLIIAVLFSAVLFSCKGPDPVEEEPEVENQTTQSVYKAYRAFCIANGFQSVSHMEFTKQIKKKYKVEVDRKRVDGKQVRMYVRK